MHKEDAVQTEAQDWPRTLTRSLQEEQALYQELRDSSRALRRALIQGLTADIGTEVERHQDLLSRMRTAQRRSAELCREAEIVPALEDFTLALLADSPAVRADARLAAQVAATDSDAREAARELAHNRQLIARLSDWMAREIRMLLEPLRETGGYGPRGVVPSGAAEPALIDRRG